MNDLPPLRRSKYFWRRVGLAPVCLLLVAGLHLYRVHARGQSAWKGGGFGMFSTVDAPRARFLRVYAVTPEGRLPLAVPARLHKIAGELCTAPSQSGLDELAGELAKLSYRDERLRWPDAAANIAANRTSAVDGSLLHPATSPVAPWRAGEPLDLVAVGRREAQRSPERNLAVQRIDVELWRYRYDRDLHELQAEKLLTSNP
jgi:hypothetical protein